MTRKPADSDLTQRLMCHKHPRTSEFSAMLLRSVDELHHGLRTLSRKLFEVDAQHHEHPNTLVGLSCFALLTAAIPAYQANDLAMVAATLLMTFTSLCADYLYIGTAAWIQGELW